MGAVLDLEQYPVSDDVEFLRDRMLHSPVPLELDPHPGSDIAVRSRVADLGAIHLLCTRSRGGDIVRSERLARDDTVPGLSVSVIERGTATVRRPDGATTLHAGDIGIYATDEPYRLAVSPDAVRFTYQVPLDALALPWDVVRAQLRTVIRPDSTTTAAVAAYLRSTARSAPTASEAEQASLARPTLELIRLLLTRTVASEPVGRGAAAESLGARIEEHVRSRLADPELSAGSVARAFSISERYVYVILARRGIDLGDEIRRDRLERARRMLEGPPGVGVTLASIAHACGFADHSHFTRAFRREFGMAPSEWRRLRSASQ